MILKTPLNEIKRFTSDTCSIEYAIGAEDGASLDGYTLRLTISSDKDGTDIILSIEGSIDSAGVAVLTWPDDLPETFVAGGHYFDLKLIDSAGEQCTLGVERFRVTAR